MYVVQFVQIVITFTTTPYVLNPMQANWVSKFPLLAHCNNFSTEGQGYQFKPIIRGPLVSLFNYSKNSIF